jgi:subtilisin-like proprotein convertase family protein/subtilisin family serine protease
MSFGEAFRSFRSKAPVQRGKRRRQTSKPRLSQARIRRSNFESLEDRCLLTATFPQAPPNDPLFPEQWNLQNTGQTGGTPGADINVLPAWEQGYLGQGVTVGVVDSGVYHAHPDLTANYRPDLSYNFFQNQPDPTPPLSPLLDPVAAGAQFGEDSHGTMVAGIIAASGNNDMGVTGIAPSAQFGAERAITFDANGNLVQGGDSQIASALAFHNQQIDIYNNSWGYIQAGPSSGSLGPPDPLTLAAMQTGATGVVNANTRVQAGRGGLGNIYVFSAGNGGNQYGFQNTNDEAETASRYAVTVAALGDDGKESLYSASGASVLVSAPGGHDGYGAPDESGIPSTSVIREPDPDNPGSFLYSPTYTDDGTFGMNGTSAAAPNVSGVIALMLSANSKLSWRDVQEILAESATQNDPTDTGWFTNGFGYTSDGAIVPVDSSGNYSGNIPLPPGVTVSPFHLNDKYGFGEVNAAAAVDLAKTWTPMQPEPPAPATSGLVNVNQPIPDGVAQGVSSSVTFTGGIHVERAEVVLNITHPQRGDIQVILTSPNGTRSILQATRSFKTANGDTTFDGTLNATGTITPNANYTNWSTTTVQDWGQSSAGTWTVTVADGDFNGQVGTFDSFQLNLYGSQDYAPIAQDVALNTLENTTATVNLFSHTYDTDGAIAVGSLKIGTQPLHGTLSANPQTGDVVYSPNLNYHGADSFTYTVLDNDGVVSRTATVSIDVGLGTSLTPVANNDVTSTTLGTPVSINVLGNDTDSNGTLIPSTVTIVTPPSVGTVQVNPSTGVVNYTPGPNFTFGDSFQYTVSDTNGKVSNIATVTINLTQATPVAGSIVQPPAGENVTQQVNVLGSVTGSYNPASVAVLTPPQHGKTAVDPVTGVVSYTPDPNFFGSDSFTYAVANFQGSLSNPASVSLTVLAQGAPIALNHEFVLVPGSPVIQGVRAQDNPDNTGTLTSKLVTQAHFGTVALNPDGTFTYLQSANFAGLDSFTYQVNNGMADSNVATIRLVTPNFHFVEKLYRDLLNRTATDADILGWVAQLNAGFNRGQLALIFLGSPEYQTRLINDTYMHLLARPVDPQGLGFWLGQMEGGLPIEAIMVAIASSPEYLAKQGGTAQSQVAGFYKDFLGRTATFTDLSYWSNQIANGTPVANVAAAFVNSTEYHDDLISGYYVSYLKHPADLGALNQFNAELNAGFPRTIVQAGILSSSEYFNQS